MSSENHTKKQKTKKLKIFVNSIINESSKPTFKCRLRETSWDAVKCRLRETSWDAVKCRLRETSWDAVKGINNPNGTYVKILEIITHDYVFQKLN